MSEAKKIKVDMEDGSVQEFTARQKLIKDSEPMEGGGIKTTLMFPNGAVRVFECNDQDMLMKLAMHGAEQKLGDECAGKAETEDTVLAVEALIDRLNAGEWTKVRQSNGMAGTSVLIQALVEAMGKDVDTIKEFLKDKTQAQKLALRQNAKISPIVQRIEAERAAQRADKAAIDTDSLLDELA